MAKLLVTSLEQKRSPEAEGARVARAGLKQSWSRGVRGTRALAGELCLVAKAAVEGKHECGLVVVVGSCFQSAGREQRLERLRRKASFVVGRNEGGANAELLNE